MTSWIFMNFCHVNTEFCAFNFLVYFNYNYTLYKNPGFWLVNSCCIFRVFSYLGLISLIFTAVGVCARGFNFFPLCRGICENVCHFFTFAASIRQIHSEYFFFTFIHKVTWLIKFETRKCSDVKDLTFFPLCRGICENVFHFFTLTCLKPPNSFGILSDITNRNTTIVPAEGNSSKRTIVFNNCQVTNNKNKIFLKTTNKRYYLFSQCSK